MKKEYKKEVLILFGQRLKELRTQKGLSLRELANECDLDNSYISKVEKGKINIQFGTIVELAAGLKVHPHELFKFEHEWRDEAFE